MTTRRDLLASIPLIGTTLAFGATVLGGDAVSAQETNSTGDDQVETPERVWIEGYASKISINHGESVALHVSTNAKNFDIVVYRLGYYAGAGAKVSHVVSDLPGARQNIPQHDPETGLLELDWPGAYTLETSPGVAEWGLCRETYSRRSGRRCRIYNLHSTQ
jgi:hypothetical protein